MAAGRATTGAAGGAPLEVRLLGAVELRRAGVALAPLGSARAESLLALLLVRRGEPLPRGRLAFLLWPDSSEAQARTNLRHVLHTLRRALPDAERLLEVTPRTLRWREDAPARVDLAEFERALAEDRLEDAVALYGGDLVEGGLDEWLLAERERVRDRLLDALARLVQRHEERGELRAAIACAERLARLDPLAEPAHLALVRLHDRAGDRVRAMRAYHAHAAVLQRELGVVPSAAMRAAYEALLLGDDAAPRPPGGGAPAPAGPPLVGRAAERERLAGAWRSAERGHAQLVLVVGEPGVGKSRLVEELRAACAGAGATTAVARAYAAEGAVAYGPLAAWLRSEALAARLHRLAPAHLTELARLVPELLEGRPGLQAPAPLPEDEQRARLLAALAAALLAPGAPLLLVADDLQWFDRPTLQALHVLLRPEPGAPLLVAATARGEELDPGHPVRELTAGLQALGRFAEVGLGRLTRAETALLAERLAGAPLGEADAQRLFADSEGNPLFLVEAVQEGGVARVAGGRVEGVIAARLARLSAPARELAGVAAVIGREFSAPVLADASGLDEPGFVGALDELWRRGIVRAHERDVYDFSHGRIRDAALGTLGPAQRRRHHLRAARALERAHAGDLDAASALLAAQLEAAGAAQEALGWHLRAAEAAQRLHDHAGAAQALERALALGRGLPEGRERDARELAVLTALPAPLNALDGYASPRLEEVHARALDLAARLGAEPEAPLVRSHALAALTRDDFAAARAAGEQLRARGVREDDDVLHVEGTWVLAVAAYWDGALGEARARLEDALARTRPEHRAEHLLRYGQDTELACLARLSHTRWLLGDPGEAARLRDRALALAAERGHPHTAALVTLWAALLALDAGDDAGLRRHARGLAAHAGGPVRRAAEALAGLLAVRDGRGAEGLARVRAAVDAGDREPAAPGERGLLARVLVEACAAEGDARAGVQAADRALGLPNGAQPWGAEVRRLRAAALRAAGAPGEQVAAALTDAAALARAQGAAPFAARIAAQAEATGRERPGERAGNAPSPIVAPSSGRP